MKKTYLIPEITVVNMAVEPFMAATLQIGVGDGDSDDSEKGKANFDWEDNEADISW